MVPEVAGVRVVPPMAGLVTMRVAVGAMPIMPGLAVMEMVTMLAELQVTTAVARVGRMGRCASMQPVMGNASIAPGASMTPVADVDAGASVTPLAGIQAVASVSPMADIHAVGSVASMARVPRVPRVPGMAAMVVQRAIDCRDQQEQACERRAAREDCEQVISGHRYVDHLQATSIGTRARTVPAPSTPSPGGRGASQVTCFSFALHAARLRTALRPLRLLASLHKCEHISSHCLSANSGTIYTIIAL
jgi:hypothetical protein